MIDTTARSHQYNQLDFARLLRRGATQHLKSHPTQGLHTRYVINPSTSRDNTGSSQPQVTVFAYESSPVRVVSQVSLPKLVLGTNVREITEDDLHAAYDLESEFVSDIIGQEFDTRTAQLCRLDLCRNFQLEKDEEVRPHIEAISAGKLPHRIRVRYGETTAYFKSASSMTLFYGKYEETLLQHRRMKASEEDLRASKGVLRFEDRYLNGRSLTALAARHKLPDKRAQTLLTTEVAERTINSRMESLGLNRQIVSVDLRKRILAERFKGRAPELLGVLAYRQEWGDDFWKRLGWSKSKFYRTRKDLMDAGLWMTTNTLHPLPALTELARQQPALRAAYHIVKAA